MQSLQTGAPVLHRVNLPRPFSLTTEYRYNVQQTLSLLNPTNTLKRQSFTKKSRKANEQLQFMPTSSGGEGQKQTKVN